MADRYLLESGAPDGYLLEDGSGVLLLEGDGSGPFFGVAGANPVLRKQRGVVHVGATLLLTTLALSGFPRGPLKAPVPKPSAQQPSASLGSNMALLASGAPEAAPFVQQAQSNPVLAKRGFVYDSAGNNLLVTTLARPSPQSAQPNPLAAPRGQAALGAVGGNLLASTLAPAAETTVWRMAPRPFNIAVRASPVPLWAPNVALLASGAETAAPFVARALPESSRAASNPQGWTWPGTPPAGAPDKPVGSAQWPNPSKTIAPVQWTVGSGLLQGGLQPLPIGRVEIQVALPRAAAQLPDLPRNLLVGTLAKPIFGTSQPNPVLAGRVPQAWTLAQPLPYDAGQKPFLQSEWPVPKVAARGNQDLAEFIAPALAAAQPTPFAQINWPNPVRRVPAALTWLSGPPLPLDGGAKPPSQTDWPNPVLPAKVFPGWQQFVSAALDQAQQKPTAQTDWPNPIRPVPAALTWKSVAPLPADGGAKPFGLTDWPNPTLRPWRGITWSSDQPPHDQGGEPLFQADWPNPVLRTPAALTWTNSRPTPLDGGEKPTAQSEWPDQSARATTRAPDQPPALLQGVLQPLPAGAASIQSAFATPRTQQAGRELNLLESTLAPSSAPLTQQQFDVPRATVRQQIGQAQNLLESTLYPLGPVFPPALEVARGAAFPQALRGWASVLPAPIDGGEKPFLQAEWPVPKGPQYPVADYAVGSPFALIRPASCPTPAEIWGYRLEGGFTAGDLLELMSAVLAGKSSIAASGNDAAQVLFRAIDDSAVRVAATMQGSERVGMSLTPGSAAPATGDGAADFWNYPIEGGYTARDVMRLIAAVLLGKTTITEAGSTITATFRSADDSADRVQAQVTSSQRTGVTLTP